jgi:hypothetical protein
LFIRRENLVQKDRLVLISDGLQLGVGDDRGWNGWIAIPASVGTGRKDVHDSGRNLGDRLLIAIMHADRECLNDGAVPDLEDSKPVVDAPDRPAARNQLTSEGTGESRIGCELPQRKTVCVQRLSVADLTDLNENGDDVLNNAKYAHDDKWYGQRKNKERKRDRESQTEIAYINSKREIRIWLEKLNEGRSRGSRRRRRDNDSAWLRARRSVVGPMMRRRTVRPRLRGVVCAWRRTVVRPRVRGVMVCLLRIHDWLV